MFYRQCLIALSELYPREDFNLLTIRSQLLWLNKYMWKGPQPFYDKEWYNRGILYVYQICDEEGHMIKPEIFFERYNLVNNSMNLLKLYSLYNAVPHEWKKNKK